MGRGSFATSVIIHLLVAVVILCTMNVKETRAVESVLKLDKKWTGDFDGMAERRLIRALVPYSKTFYFLDGADQRGLTYELLREFEKYINKRLRRTTLRIQLVVIPTKRDRLLPALIEGLGDIAAGNLTITPARQKRVDFSAPPLTGVEEIVVIGPKAPPVQAMDDLAGKEIHVRASSSYYESLQRLDAQFKKKGKEQMRVLLVRKSSSGPTVRLVGPCARTAPS